MARQFNISAVQVAARKYGLLRLSEKTGLARSYLYKVVEGTSSPTLEAFDKIISALGFEIELRRKPLPSSVQEVSARVAKDGNWKLHYFNLVDALRHTKDPELIKNPPSTKLGEKERALLASIVSSIGLEIGIETPKWAKEQSPLKEPWFVSGMENLKAIAIAESPVSFKKNNIFVMENFLARA